MLKPTPRPPGTAWSLATVLLLPGCGNEDVSKVPAVESGGQRWRMLSAGGTATCGVTTGGQAMCFGLNSNGAVGQNKLGP